MAGTVALYDDSPVVLGAIGTVMLGMIGAVGLADGAIDIGAM